MGRKGKDSIRQRRGLGLLYLERVRVIVFGGGK
jgi:hypothetical protein